jgi:hypothetical protein
MGTEQSTSNKLILILLGSKAMASLYLPITFKFLRKRVSAGPYTSPNNF